MLAKLWKDHVYDKFHTKVEEWTQEINRLFDAKERHNRGMQRIDATKSKLFGLDKPEVPVWETKGKEPQKGKEGKPKEEEPTIPLNKYRDYAKGIQAYFNNINQAFGIKQAPKRK
jgi:hypothetical protein